MTQPGGSVEGITVPLGDPDALRASAGQMRGVAGHLSDAGAQLAGFPGLMSNWAGPASSAFAQLSGQQAVTVRSASLSVTMAALSVQDAANVLEDAQRDARRATEHARTARREINAAKADIVQARDDAAAAQTRITAAEAAQLNAATDPVANLAGGTPAQAAAIAAAETNRRNAERDLTDAHTRERHARTRLEHAQDDLRRARRDGRDAADSAETSALALQGALATMPAPVTAMPGMPARGIVGAQAGVRRVEPRKVPLGEREPPSNWPGPMKSLFKVGRGEAVTISGLWHTGRSAVEHPDKVPGALYDVGDRAVHDPLGTGKLLIGYDELAKGRYADWAGQMGLVALTGGAGGTAGRAARLRRVIGPAKLYRLGPNSPRWGSAFAGKRLDFAKPDLGARNAVNAPRNRLDLAAAYPRGVRYTRAGHPVFTPYAEQRVRVGGLTGDMGHDVPLANAKAGIPGNQTPAGYTWHHGEDGRTMELVPKDLHKAVLHTGGRAAIPDQVHEVTLGGDFTFGERAAGHAGGLGGAAVAGPGGGP